MATDHHDQRLTVYLTREERMEVGTAARRAELPPATWGRLALLAAARGATTPTRNAATAAATPDPTITTPRGTE